MMRVKALIVAALLIAALDVHAYSVSVNKVPEFEKSFLKLALLPGSGPTGFDTIWLDDLLLQKLAARSVPVTPANVVRQAMFELELKELTAEGRARLAEKLDVDAFIVAVVDAAATENSGTVGLFAAGIFTAIPSERNTGSVQLAIVSATSGKVLMQGSGHGQSELRSKRGVIGKTFDRILDQVFTPQYFVAKRATASQQ